MTDQYFNTVTIITRRNLEIWETKKSEMDYIKSEWAKTHDDPDPLLEQMEGTIIGRIAAYKEILEVLERMP